MCFKICFTALFIALELMDFNQVLYIDCWFRLQAVLHCIYHGAVAVAMRLKYVFNEYLDQIYACIVSIHVLAVTRHYYKVLALVLVLHANKILLTL